MLSYLFPITLLRTSSIHNRDIRVSLDRGELKLLVNGSRQSGAFIRWLWQSALREFSLPLQVNSILVLGVGGGTVIKLLRTKYPQAQITAVDIDQVIINIANTYFDVSCHCEQITIINDDAAKFVPQKIRQRHRYDLVVVDLFSGREIPDFVSSAEFIRNCQKALRPAGTLLINFLRELEYAPRAQALAIKLKQIFPTVKSFEIANNIFFSCFRSVFGLDQSYVS